MGKEIIMRKYLLLSLLIMGCYSGSGIYSVRNDKDPYNDTNILKQIDNGIMGFMNIDNANSYYFNIYYDVDKKLNNHSHGISQIFECYLIL